MKKILLAFCLSQVALADVCYTKKVTMHGGPSEAGMSMQQRTKTYIKNKRERLETEIQVGPMRMREVSLTLCDLEKRASLEPDLKIYEESSLAPMVTQMPPKFGEEEPSRPKSKPGTGSMDMKVEVKELPSEKILSLQTRHFRIKMTLTTTGCCGDSHMVQEREVWMAPELPRLVCPVREGQRDYSDRSSGSGEECKVKVTRSGDLKLYDEALQGEAVKEILYMDGKPVMTTELVEYSKALLEDSLFSLDGLRKVSSEEFESQKQQQMMKSIMQQSNP